MQSHRSMYVQKISTLKQHHSLHQFSPAQISKRFLQTFTVAGLETSTSLVQKQNSFAHLPKFKVFCEKEHMLTSVSRNLRNALFFLMLLRRTYTANVRPTMTMMKRPPITPAAIRGVLAIRTRDFIVSQVTDQRTARYIKYNHSENNLCCNCFTTVTQSVQIASQGKHINMCYNYSCFLIYIPGSLFFKLPCTCEELCGQGDTTCTLMANANLQWQNEDTSIWSSPARGLPMLTFGSNQINSWNCIFRKPKTN